MSAGITTCKHLARYLAAVTAQVRDRLLRGHGELRHPCLDGVPAAGTTREERADVLAQLVVQGLLIPDLAGEPPPEVADSPALARLPRDVDMDAVRADFGRRFPHDEFGLHFHELFLQEHHPGRRKERGVYYTPYPVVAFLVRGADEMLRTEFGLTDGLADVTSWRALSGRHAGLAVPDGTDPDSPFVQILDPACGTGAFLVEDIRVMHRNMRERWRRHGRAEAEWPELWREYVPRFLLPRLHGCEALPVPWAIAQANVARALAETGYRLAPGERAHLRLGNALTEPSAADGAATVILGNPPYAARSANLDVEFRTLIDRYRVAAGQPVRERGMLQLEKNLQDDYVKFLALAERRVTAAGLGLVGLVTNHSYLDAPTLRGLRWSLATTFDAIQVIDLHGNANKREAAPSGGKDENVFGIRQGTAVCLLLRLQARREPGRLARVSRSDVWGTREAKSRLLLGASAATLERHPVSLRPADYHFVATAAADRLWEASWPLPAVFRKYSTGTETGCDALLLAFDRDRLLDGIRRFVDGCSLDVSATAGHAGCLHGRRGDFDLARADGYAAAFQFRPFDYRVAYLKKDLLKTNSFNVMTELAPGRPGLIATRQTKEQFGVFVSGGFCGHKCISRYDRSYVFPSTVRTAAGSEPGFTLAFRQALRDALRLPWDDATGMPAGVTAMDVFHYVYAVLRAPSYQARFRDRLTREFPRVPVPRDRVLFWALVPWGAELRALHLLHGRNVGNLPPESVRFHGTDRRVAPGYPQYRNGAVYLNSSGRFAEVSETVWRQQIGAYRVCEQWLKDRRGRLLSAQDIRHYARVLAALSRTARVEAQADPLVKRVLG